MKPLAITGLGIFLPEHTQTDDVFSSLYDSQSLLKHERLCHQQETVTQVCSSVSPTDLEELYALYPELNKTHICLSAKMAIFAANQAATQAELCGESLGRRLGCFIGSNKNLMPIQSLAELWRQDQGKAIDDIQATAIAHQIQQLDQNQTAHMVAESLSIQGPVKTHSDACTAGAAAIYSALKRVQSGDIDVALVGASEHATHPIMQMSFAKMGALSTKRQEDPSEASRPFDKDRSGCLLADGSAFLVIESVEHAKARGANILAYLSGGSRQSEAHKFTSTDPSGSYYVDCMQAALADAKLRADDIDHINAHGTSTPANDSAESLAIAQVFNARNDQSTTQPSVTSTKSALGHSLGATAAVEAVLCVKSLLNQKVLPTLNYQEPAEGEPSLNIVTQGKTQSLKHVMSNSFGFGGENASLIFSRASA